MNIVNNNSNRSYISKLILDVIVTKLVILDEDVKRILMNAKEIAKSAIMTVRYNRYSFL